MLTGWTSRCLAAAAVVTLAGGLAHDRMASAQAVQPPPAPAQPAAPALPAGATVAFVNTGAVASQSKLGQAFAAELTALREAKGKELTARQQEFQAAQQKLQEALSMTDAARVALQREVDRLGRELQFMTDNAQAEMNDLQADVQRRFDEALGLVLDQVASAHGLQMVFGQTESGLLWASRSLDLTAALVAALDAAHPGGQ